MKIPGPEHPITITPAKGRVIVRFGDVVVADSGNALELIEASYRPVFYIPRGDARLEYYEASERNTHCPYKGDANYFDLKANGLRSENAVWTYETPFPAMREIAGHVAFYPDKVSITRE